MDLLKFQKPSKIKTNYLYNKLMNKMNNKNINPKQK